MPLLLWSEMFRHMQAAVHSIVLHHYSPPRISETVYCTSAWVGFTRWHVRASLPPSPPLNISVVFFVQSKHQKWACLLEVRPNYPLCFLKRKFNDWFSPCLWRKTDNNELSREGSVCERWAVGVHLSVGYEARLEQRSHLTSYSASLHLHSRKNLCAQVCSSLSY
jgi:hypothetical protein